MIASRNRRVGHAAVALFAVAATSASTAATAVAAAPPRGTYGCTTGGGYAGDLHILDGSHYRINNGRRGRYQTRGHKIKFVTGDWAGLFRSGRWYLAQGTGGRMDVEIAMTDKAGYEDTYCDRQ